MAGRRSRRIRAPNGLMVISCDCRNSLADYWLSLSVVPQHQDFSPGHKLPDGRGFSLAISVAVVDSGRAVRLGVGIVSRRGPDNSDGRAETRRRAASDRNQPSLRLWCLLLFMGVGGRAVRIASPPVLMPNVQRRTIRRQSQTP
jgi:hypothetical protein